MSLRLAPEIISYSTIEDQGKHAFGNISSRYRRHRNMENFTGLYKGKWFFEGVPQRPLEKKREKKPGRRNGSR